MAVLETAALVLGGASALGSIFGGGSQRRAARRQAQFQRAQFAQQSEQWQAQKQFSAQQGLFQQAQYSSSLSEWREAMVMRDKQIEISGEITDREIKTLDIQERIARMREMRDVGETLRERGMLDATAISQAEAQGVARSSGLAGAQASIGAQTAGELGFMSATRAGSIEVSDLSREITRLSGEAAKLIPKPAKPVPIPSPPPIEGTEYLNNTPGLRDYWISNRDQAMRHSGAGTAEEFAVWHEKNWGHPDWNPKTNRVESK